MPADPVPNTTGFTESSVEPEHRDGTESSPSSPANPEVSETTQLPMNGMLGALQKYVFVVVMVVRYTVRNA